MPQAKQHCSAADIKRIKRMEKRLIHVREAVDELFKAQHNNHQEGRPETDVSQLLCDNIQKDIAALKDYMDSGDWQHDYELDEAGLLPQNLKRGILSQDSLWNLLEDIRSIGPLSDSHRAE